MQIVGLLPRWEPGLLPEIGKNKYPTPPWNPELRIFTLAAAAAAAASSNSGRAREVSVGGGASNGVSALRRRAADLGTRSEGPGPGEKAGRGGVRSREGAS